MTQFVILFSYFMFIVILYGATVSETAEKHCDFPQCLFRLTIRYLENQTKNIVAMSFANLH